MLAFFKKSGRWAILYSCILAFFTAYVLLDTFVIPKSYASETTANNTNVVVSTQNTTAASSQETTSQQAVITDTSYTDEHIQINIDQVRAYNTTLYVADIYIDDPAYLQTALAQNVYGRNIKETTSDIASNNNAILAINGDYYGFRDSGYVIRNKTIYRDTTENKEVLVIDESGDFSVVQDTSISAQELVNQGATQVLSFGPTLVNNGEIVVGENEEISGKSMNSNPRTAIAQIDTLHYVLIVSDGRTDESEGLSLYQLASELQARGAKVAYNLDGGGSSTMVFNGTVLNQTVAGRGSSEREVSDIVYFGYSNKN